MKTFFLSILITITAANAFATVQIGERMIFNGATHWMSTEPIRLPLESYFSEDNPRPDFLKPISTACYRGYIGTWKIEDGWLYLVSLHRNKYQNGKKERVDVLNKVIRDGKSPVKATWFSGVLRLRKGKAIKPGYGFQPMYETNIYITIKKGKFIAEHTIDNKGKGSTLSKQDLHWVFLAEKPVEDDGNWYDARIIDTPEFQKTIGFDTDFITRGIFSKREKNEPGHLYIPSTLATDAVIVPFQSIPENHGVSNYSHVEVEGHLIKGINDYSLSVKSIRKLKPGESIHHPNFKPPNYSKYSNKQ